MTTYIDPLKADFRNFLFLAFKVFGHDPSRLQYDIAEWLADSTVKWRGVQGHRGAGKSYITATLAAWFLYCDPNDTVICISQNQLKAGEFIGLTRQLIENMPELAHLRPGEYDKDGAFKFVVGARTVVSKDPSVAAFGSTSMVTGSHANKIILDDCETRKNSETVEAREKLFNFISVELTSVVNPGGDVITLGTPHNRDSTYNRLEREKVVVFRRYPLEYPDLNADIMETLSPMLKDDLLSGRAKIGDPTHPERFDELEIAERKGKMGPTGYALQMMLDTSLSDAARYPLKLKDFIVMPIHGHVAPARVVWGTNPIDDIPSVGLKGDHFNAPIFYEKDRFQDFQKSVMFIDPAGTGSDELAFAVAKLLNGSIFVPAWDGMLGGYAEENLRKLAMVTQMHGVKRIVVEQNFGDGMFERLLAPVVARVCGPVLVESKRSGNKQKEIRIIDTLEPLLAAHRVIITPDLARCVPNMLQVTGITRTKGCLQRDDRVEALAGACAEFALDVGVDSEKRVADDKLAEVQAAAKKFIEDWHKGGNGRFSIGAMPEGLDTGAARSPFAKRNRWGWGSSRLTKGR